MDTRTIGDIFRENTGVTEEQLTEAMQVRERTGEPLGQILVKMDAITEKEKVKCLGKQWGIPFVDLVDYEPKAEVIGQFPVHVMRQYKVVPLEFRDGQVILAMVNPIDIFSIDEIQITTGFKVNPVIAAEEDIAAVLNRSASVGDEVRQKLVSVLDEFGHKDLNIETVRHDEELSSEEILGMVDEAPIVRLVNIVIGQALQDGASDIHIQPETDRVRVRYRVDGVMRDGMTVPKAAQAALINRVKVMADIDISERRQPQDGRISLTVNGREYDFRVSTLPGVQGEKTVLRILDKMGISVGLEKLGFDPETMARFEDLIRRSWGIILVTGPTGSGKSTTLYSALHTINTGQENILTIEDPVEYQVGGITQSHVNVKAGLTFASALRSMLRQDPDIIMVGEIRDRETALIATEAALTGHLVLSTLHTNDAPGAIARLMDMNIEPFLIASSVIGVLAQRLVRKVCVKCAEPFTPPEQSLRRLNISPERAAAAHFSRGRGCDNCGGTGYKGRIGVFELMMVTDTIREAVLREEPSHVIGEIARSEGMKMLGLDGMEKVLAGTTTPEELLRVVYAA